MNPFEQLIAAIQKAAAGSEYGLGPKTLTGDYNRWLNGALNNSPASTQAAWGFVDGVKGSTFAAKLKAYLTRGKSMGVSQIKQFNSMAGEVDKIMPDVQRQLGVPVTDPMRIRDTPGAAPAAAAGAKGGRWGPAGPGQPTGRTPGPALVSSGTTMQGTTTSQTGLPPQRFNAGGKPVPPSQYAAGGMGSAAVTGATSAAPAAPGLWRKFTDMFKKKGAKMFTGAKPGPGNTGLAVYDPATAAAGARAGAGKLPKVPVTTTEMFAKYAQYAAVYFIAQGLANTASGIISEARRDTGAQAKAIEAQSRLDIAKINALPTEEDEVRRALVQQSLMQSQQMATNPMMQGAPAGLMPPGMQALGGMPGMGGMGGPPMQGPPPAGTPSPVSFRGM